jgi:ArsR family transcriptional regulator, arsenate/arsenite/antimonite-responsive transcriptional repressor
METTASVDLEALARAFHALADSKRLEIVRLLTNGERCVCDLTEVVGAKQSLLSFHLKILREAGLVTSRRRGKWMYYSLNYEFIEEMRAIIGSVADGREHLESCCCESLCCPTEKDPVVIARERP